MHDLQGFFVAVDIVHDVAMFDHHALGTARGTRGIDAVGQIAGADSHSGIRRGKAVRIHFLQARNTEGFLQGQYRVARPGQRTALHLLFRGQQQGAGPVLQAEVDAVIRVFRDEGQESGSRFQHRDFRHVSPNLPVKQHADHPVFSSAFCNQNICQMSA